MQLFNSKSNKTEVFTPMTPGEVHMYVCGPTVYNYIHIGNARPMIVFDTLRRVFEAEGLKVKYVSNYTDVDDKIINKAIAENVDETVIAQRYIDAYQSVRDRLHTRPLSATPRVTETMDDIIAFIAELVKKGNAYNVGGNVYFRVNSVEGYGEISKQNIDDLIVGARVDEETEKESPLDFALWKKTEQGIQWDSPWGKGRPGWHTECVVMIQKNFGAQIDIHGGGMDLKFPHHENEAAQAKAMYGHGLSTLWIHNGMLNIDGEKMSKSLGNVLWAKDVVDKVGANVVRWMMLSAHYRAPLSISDDTIEQAIIELLKAETVLKQVELKAQLSEMKLDDTIESSHKEAFMNAMEDDLNTPNGFMEIFEVIKDLNQHLRSRQIIATQISSLYNSLRFMLETLGIEIEPVGLSDEDRADYVKWSDAKTAKDFATADAIRLKLSEAGKL